MPTRAAEARLWQVLGMAFLVGGGLPLGLNLLHIASIRLAEADALELGAWYALIILLGLVALVTARVVTAKEGVRYEHLDWIWTVLAWVTMPLGAAIFDLEWSRTAIGQATLNQKATLMAGGFMFLTGLIALLGERAVQRIQDSAIRQTLSEVEQQTLAGASHEIN